MPSRARLLVADAHGHLGPRRAPRAPPVGHAHDQARRLEGGDRLQEAVRLGRRPRHAARRPRRSRPARPATAPARRRAAAGTRRCSSAWRSLARGGLLQRLRQRPVLDLAAGPRAHRVGGEEGERVVLVAAVLGQVQADLADDVPRRDGARAATRRPARDARGSRRRTHDSSPPSARPPSRASTYSAPSIGGTAPASRAASSGGQSISTRSRWSSRSGTAQSRVTNARPMSRRNARSGASAASSSVAPRSRMRVAGAALGGARETGLRGGSETVGGVVLGRRGLESESPGGENRDADPGDRVSRRRAWHPRAAYQRRGPPMVRSPAPATLDVSFPGLFRLHRPGLYAGRWDGSQHEPGGGAMAVEVVAATRRRFTRTEYYRMAEAGILGERDRVELIEGEIIEMSPIGRRHRAFVDNLNRLLARRLPDDAIVSVQGPLALADDTEPQPDLTVLRRRAVPYKEREAWAEDALLRDRGRRHLARLRPLDQAPALRRGRHPGVLGGRLRRRDRRGAPRSRPGATGRPPGGRPWRR